jgi:predicted nucleic acid-binding protein
MLYLDTGCLVQLYFPEPKSARIAAKAVGRPLVFTPLHHLEITSALRLKIFRREATEDQVRATLQLVTEDLEAGKLVESDIVNRSTLQAAIDLANRHSAATGSRSLDTLHCALAASLDIEAFLSTAASAVPP